MNTPGEPGGSISLNAGRIAELETTSPTGGVARGSGYLVATGTVLTAAHVVDGAAKVVVRLDGRRTGERVLAGEVVWSDRRTDVAVVRVASASGEPVTRVRFARIEDRHTDVRCEAAGFPRFKLRADPAAADAAPVALLRDLFRMSGTCSGLSNRLTGTLEISVAGPLPAPDPTGSPWQGMSGAALWSSGRIVGVISEHHPAEGAGRLTASRVDRWYETLAPEQCAELAELVGLPTERSALPSAVTTWDEDVAADNRLRWRDIAPEALHDREAELADLATFVHGDEAYAWWQGGPWTGKTALLSWFALHPPEDVTVVSCFLMRRAGQAGTDAFVRAMSEQLAAVAGVRAPFSDPGATGTEWHGLLHRAAERVEAAGRRLLLVVDGLDEDPALAAESEELPTVAAALPVTPPRGVRVLVSSRPYAAILDFLPDGHPLLSCRRPELGHSPHAGSAEHLARAEIRRLVRLRGPRDVLALITASGSGLTVREIAELTGQLSFDVADALQRVFGRCLQLMHRSAIATADGQDRRAFVFAHDTLRATAEEQLGDDMPAFRERLYAWADSYRARGWPSTTPDFLWDPYGRLVTSAGATDRLVALAIDPVRHERLLDSGASDGAALWEIASAQRALAAEPVPDLGQLVVLAAESSRLRGRAVSAELPALWAALGHWRRCDELIDCLSPGPQRVRAAALASAAAARDRPQWAADRADEAERGALDIVDLQERAALLQELLRLTAPDDTERVDRLAALAEETAMALVDPRLRVCALAAVADALAPTELGQALRILRAIRKIAENTAEDWERGEMLESVVTGLCGLGRWREAKHTAVAMPDGLAAHRSRRHSALQDVAVAAAEAGYADEAIALAWGMRDPAATAATLAAVAAVLARAPEADTDRTTALVDAAVDMIGHVPYDYDRRSLRRQLQYYLADSFLPQALSLARAADRADDGPELDPETDHLSTVRVLVKAGEWAEAEERARRYDERAKYRDEGFRLLVEGRLGEGDFSGAARIARLIGDCSVRAARLVETAHRMLASDPAGAAELAGEAERTARLAGDRAAPLVVVLHMAQDLADADARAADLALEALAEFSDDERVAEVAVGILVSAKQWTAAEQAVHSMSPGLWAQGSQLCRLVHDVALDVGLPAAERMVDRSPAQLRDHALEGLANGRLELGDWQGAKTVAEGIEGLLRRADVLEAVAVEAAKIEPERALAMVLMIGNLRAAYPGVVPEGHGHRAAATKILAAAGRWAEAEETALGFPGESDRGRVIADVVTAMAAAREWEPAEAMAARITDPTQRIAAQSRLVAGLADAGEWQRAETMLADIPDPATVDRARLHIVEAAARTGNWTTATRIADAVADAAERSRAWALIARVQPDNAEAIAATPYPADRVSQALVEALLAESWSDALPSVTRNCPQALATVGAWRALLSTTRSSESQV